MFKTPTAHFSGTTSLGHLFRKSFLSHTVIYIHFFFFNLGKVAKMVKNPPVMQETRVQSLGQEYPLEKGMATHCSILAEKIPQTEEPGGLQSMGSQGARHDSLPPTLHLGSFTFSPPQNVQMHSTLFPDPTQPSPLLPQAPPPQMPAAPDKPP